MNRIFALVAVVALLGFAIWAVLSPAPTESSATTLPQSPAVAPTLEEIPDLAPVPAPASADFQASPEVERSTYLPASPAIDPNVTYAESADEGILISVVDADSGEILPHAEVMVIDMGTVDTSAIETEMMRQPDFEGLFLHFGVIYPTDKQGQVRVPFPEGEMVLAGRTATHFDFVFNLEMEDNVYELQIKKVSLLRVHLVDPNGQAVAGAPVGLRQRSGSFSNALMRNFTDEQGWANLRLFPMLIENMDANETYAALLGLYAEPVEEPVDLKKLPADGVTLVMPKSGSLTVNLLEEQGLPMQELVAVSLKRADPNQAQSSSDIKMGPDLVDTSSNGKVVFSAVGFDLDVIVEARNMGGILSGMSIVSGPTASQPHVEVDVTMKMEAAIIKGRLVNTEGKPGPNLSLRSSLESVHGTRTNSIGSQIRTDGEGYFRFKLDQPIIQEGQTRSLTLTFRATRKKPERAVKIDLSRSFPTGETDIGDAMLTVPPIAVAGVILKPDGAPLPDAEVRLEKRNTWGDGSDDFWWENLWDFNAKSDQEGAFTISGQLDPGSYRLRVQSKHYPSLFYEVNIGTEGHKIVMVAGGSLKGVLLLDENVPHDGIGITLESHPLNPLEGKGHGISPVRMNSEGDFVSHGLPLGTVDLIVRCEKTSEELLRIDGLPVSGDAEEPYDAGIIDLRGKLAVFTVRFVDSNDEPLEQVQIQTDDSGFTQWLWRENLVVVTAESSKSFRVSCKGYRTVELNNVSKDTTVVMEDGIKVRIRISNPGVIPTGYQAGMSLRDADKSRTSSHMIGGEMDILNNNFEQVLVAMKPGTFSVQVHLARTSTLTTDGWWNVAASPGSTNIEVLDVPGEQFFVIVLDSDNIAEILEKFKN